MSIFAGKTPLCIICRLPAADGFIPSSQVNMEKLRRWHYMVCKRHLMELEGQLQEVVCYYCIWQAQFLRENASIVQSKTRVCWWPKDFDSKGTAQVQRKLFLEGKLDQCWVKLDNLILPVPPGLDGNLKAKCFFCGEMRRHLFTHLEKVHTDLTKKCESNVCFKYFETEIKRVLHFNLCHQRSHEPPLKYVCLYCADASFDDPVYYIRHMRKVHPDITFKCPERDCVFFFKTDEAVNAHLHAVHGVREQGDVFRCHSCDFKTNVYSNLVKHMRKNHLAVKIIKCLTCTEVFITLSDLKRHEKVVHRVMACSYCRQHVETLKMDKHVNHECSQCMNTLLCAGFLEKHLSKKCQGKKIIHKKLKRKFKVKCYNKIGAALSLKKLKSENNNTL
ncbi:Hypothetical predicted protein [Cloeon dipterum]|uniref:C2H2-type domain-containing protein n=1 Tax=Cloeon dipterum TaxID=197152 RepID=A0A8S1CKA1_9INSE|nr:Hypothetical predicted protein [Cloeon dipterum]